ncbi:MAG TPA: GIY-YIG nuclease family protein, partial [Methanosarcina sp.]|nr:GIY-YIG nuclease family protein [Methanosarcina sp.]
MDISNFPGFHEPVKLWSRRFETPIRNKPGLYILVHEKTEKLYIGSALKVGARIVHHISDLRNKVHPNHLMQEAWDDDNSFRALVKLTETREEAYREEQEWIDKLKGTGILLNISTEDVSAPTKGLKF